MQGKLQIELIFTIFHLSLLVHPAGDLASDSSVLRHGVPRRMISVDNFFVFSRLLIFALVLLYVTWCTLWRLRMTFLKC